MKWQGIASAPGYLVSLYVLSECDNVKLFIYCSGCCPNVSFNKQSG